jgi:hypothetical protein
MQELAIPGARGASLAQEACGGCWPWRGSRRWRRTCYHSGSNLLNRNS